MATYLLTGAAGFIASRTAELLLEEGHSVVGVDNLNDAYDVRLKEWRLARLREYKNFVFYQIDIVDRASLRQAAEDGLRSLDAPGYAGLINLAARAGVRQSVANPWVYVDTNVTGTLNTLELCRELGIQKYILSSTSSLYGMRNPQPFREDADTNGPLSPYAASKKSAEAFCHTYHYLYGLDITIFRYFTVYGPAGRPDMSLFRFVQWISEGLPVYVYGDGTQGRDFTYVDDIARGTILGLKPLGFEVINLGSDRPALLMDTIHLVEELLARPAQITYQPRHPADVLTTWADISKADQLLGWRPQMMLADGVANLVAWYRENQAWARLITTDL